MKKSIKAQRIEWLKKRKLTIRKFAEAVGHDYGTAYLWFRTNRNPRRLYLDGILAVYQDWPHVA